MSTPETVLKQLTSAGISPNVPVIAILPAGSRAATMLAAADKEGLKAIETVIGKDAVTDIGDSVTNHLDDFKASTYSESTYSQIYNSTKTLAAKYLSLGIYDSAGDAAEAAAEDVINSRYEFNENYRVPVEHNLGHVSSGVDIAANKIMEMDLMSPQSDLPEDVAKDVYIKRLKPKLVTMNDDSGMVAVDQNMSPILRADGSLIEYTWDDLTFMSNEDTGWF